MNLRDKVAIVTGASRGIGKAIALGLAKEGAVVVVAARTETPSEKAPGSISETAQEIEAQGGRAIAVRCDVSDESSVDNLVGETLGRFGRVDILVNNAGAGSYLPFQETSVRMWDRVFAVNVRGTFLCTRAVLPTMIAQRGGSIINISSTGADTVFSMTRSPGSERTLIGIVYGASKVAIERMTVGLAAEVGKFNIAVNAIKPGSPVLTEGLKAWRPNADLSQWVGPEKMVKAALFLAAQDAKGVTGQVIIDDELILRHGL